MPDEDDSKARKVIASVIGESVSKLESTETGEVIRDYTYTPRDTPFTLAEHILRLLVRDRIAALASRDAGRIAESGVSPAAGTIPPAKLREFDERLSAIESSLGEREVDRELQLCRMRQETAEREAQRTLRAAGLL